MKVITCPNTSEYVIAFEKKLKEKGVETISLKFITPATLLKILFLRIKGYNIFHLHFIHSFAFILWMKIFVSFAKFIGYKIFWTGHSMFQPENKKRSILKTRWFYNNSDLRFIHHKAHFKLLEEEVGIKDFGKTKMIFHPIFDTYENNTNKTESRKKLDVPPDKKILLILGDIKKYKGINFLIEALEKLGDEYFLIIAGRPLDEGVINHIEEKQKKLKNIKLVKHFIPNNEVQYYMNACDVFVLPYTLIWTSGAVKLAYAFSRPVVSTKVGTMPEVVNDKTGILVEPCDSDEFANGIKKIFEKDYEQMGKNAYKMMKEEYSWDKLIDLTIEGYKEIIEK